MRSSKGSRTAVIPRPEPGGLLADWAQRSGHATLEPGSGGGLRSAFYGRVSTEDWQDPVTSLAAAAAGRRAGGLADPGSSWDAIVVGEYERAFYGN